MWLFISAAAIILIGLLCRYLSRAKCPDCNSRKVREIGRTELDSEPKLFKETVKIKEFDNKCNSRTDYGQQAVTNQYINPPSKIITQEVVVEGKRTWYRVHYKCNKCNSEFSVKEYIDTKPQIE